MTTLMEKVPRHGSSRRNDDRRHGACRYSRHRAEGLSRRSGHVGRWRLDVGGTDDDESIATVCAALDYGINVIATAPAYGFGRSEEIVGRALAEAGMRGRVLIATKVGLDWRDGKVFRNASRQRIMREIDDSLRRLRTDHVDVYRCTGPTRWCRSRKPPMPCTRCSARARSGRSASAISRSRRWTRSTAWRPCTWFNRPCGPKDYQRPGEFSSTRRPF